MSAEDWSAKYRTLAEAGHPVLGADAKDKPPTPPNLTPWTEAASASKTVMFHSPSPHEIPADCHT